MRFWGDFGGMGKDISWNVHPSSELCVFRQLWSRSEVVFCMGIAICHRRKFGQVLGSQLPYQKSQGKSGAVRHSGSVRHPLGPSTTTWINCYYSVFNIC